MTREKKLAIQIAKEAGRIMKAHFSFGIKKDWKSDNTPVTEADIKINDMVLFRIKKTFPYHNILAEEKSDFHGASEWVWVCDPLDGTIPFSHGVPTSVFSLALTHCGKSVLGVVYDPWQDRMYVAEKGKGAWLNGKKITVSNISTMKNSVFGVSWSRHSPINLLPLVEKLVLADARVYNFGSIVYMGALVALGEFGGIVFPNSAPHDAAALKILVEEAGGKVTDIMGREQRYDQPIKGIIAANRIMHRKILNIVKILL